MRILKTCLVIGALLSALFFTGCATITRGRTEQITVLSEPTGASVRLGNGNTGVTPATFTVPRKGDVYVTVFKDGYETAGMVVPAKLSSTGTVGFLGNALIGGVIGGGVDVYTGATLSHVPNPVIFKLVPKAAPAPAASPGVPSPAPVAAAKPAASEAPPPAQTSPPAAGPGTPPAPAPVEPTKPPAADSPPPAAPAAQPAPGPTPPQSKPAPDPTLPEQAPPPTPSAPAPVSPSDGKDGTVPATPAPEKK